MKWPWSPADAPTVLDLVLCAKCRHAFDKKSAQVVKRYFFGEDTLYYCPSDRVPYDSSYTSSYTAFGGTRFYKTVQVSESGEPVGYVKASTEKVAE